MLSLIEEFSSTTAWLRTNHVDGFLFVCWKKIHRIATNRSEYRIFTEQ